MTLQLPMDFREAPFFRRLGRLLGSDPLAAWALLLLWRQLAYLAADGGLPGRLSAGELAEVCREIAGDAPDDVAVQAALTHPEVKLLVAEPAADGAMTYFSARFHQLHGTSFNPATRKMAQRGGDGKAYAAAVRRAEEESPGLALLLPAVLMVDAAGQPLDAETCARYHRLIRILDNALFRGDRPEHLHSRDMVANALPVLAAHTDEQIAAVGRQIALRRGDSALVTMTTEKLLPQFTSLARMLASQ
jgi:hypothetical protein